MQNRKGLAMYKTAYKYSDDVIFYFDEWSNKHVATGGNISWRIRNPGLIRSRTPIASLNGSKQVIDRG